MPRSAFTGASRRPWYRPGISASTAIPARRFPAADPPAPPHVGGRRDRVFRRSPHRGSCGAALQHRGFAPYGRTVRGRWASSPFGTRSRRNEASPSERQDIVYRDAPQGQNRQPAPASAAREEQPSADLAWTVDASCASVPLFGPVLQSHRIHYDQPYATEVEGYPGLVVHGPCRPPSSSTSPPFSGEEHRVCYATAASSVFGGKAFRVLGARAHARRRGMLECDGRRCDRDEGRSGVVAQGE